MSSKTRSSWDRYLVVGAVAEKAGGLDRRVQAHLLGGSQYPPGEGELHHRLAAGNGDAAIQRPQRRRKLAEPADHLRGRDVSSVLQVPGIGIVAVGAAKQAARHEQNQPQAGSVVAGRRLVGMDIAKRALAVVAKLRLVRRVRRYPDVQVMAAARLKAAEL